MTYSVEALIETGLKYRFTVSTNRELGLALAWEQLPLTEVLENGSSEMRGVQGGVQRGRREGQSGAGALQVC